LEFFGEIDFDDTYDYRAGEEEALIVLDTGVLSAAFRRTTKGTRESTVVAQSQSGSSPAPPAGLRLR